MSVMQRAGTATGLFKRANVEETYCVITFYIDFITFGFRIFCLRISML